MYGTVCTARALPGRRKDVVDLMRSWDVGDKPAGAVATYVYELDQSPDDLMIAVVFKDKDSYTANSHSPESEEWYGKFRALLSEDPQWADGEVTGPGA